MTIDKEGNILILCPNHPFANNKGLIRLDRLVIETAFSCILLPLTIIRHINKDIKDCGLSNLEMAHPHHKNIIYNCSIGLKESRIEIARVKRRKPISKPKTTVQLQFKCSMKRFGKPNCNKCQDLKNCDLHMKG